MNRISRIFRLKQSGMETARVRNQDQPPNYLRCRTDYCVYIPEKHVKEVFGGIGSVATLTL